MPIELPVPEIVLKQQDRNGETDLLKVCADEVTMSVSI